MFGSLKKLFGGEEKDEKVIAAPVSGKAVPMSQVNEGKIVAPADGQVTMVFDTKHALSIQTDNGAELIIHVGLDTVQLKGQYFEAHVQAGDRVKKGDLLLDFDMDKIKEAGYDVITPVIVCNTPQFPKMECISGMEVKAGETAIIQL